MHLDGPMRLVGAALLLALSGAVALADDAKPADGEARRDARQGPAPGRPDDPRDPPGSAVRPHARHVCRGGSRSGCRWVHRRHPRRRRGDPAVGCRRTGRARGACSRQHHHAAGPGKADSAGDAAPAAPKAPAKPGEPQPADPYAASAGDPAPADPYADPVEVVERGKAARHRPGRRAGRRGARAPRRPRLRSPPLRPRRRSPPRSRRSRPRARRPTTRPRSPRS